VKPKLVQYLSTGGTLIIKKRKYMTKNIRCNTLVIGGKLYVD
jgi:cytoskeletal protein CcmA (bactofilin family)